MGETAGYRADVDGLRAIAVLAVLFFHAGFDGFQGGFVGVDIFFVISGYLIIGFVAKQADHGKFGLLEFYVRRARRLVPAAVPVLFFSLMIAFVTFSYAGFLEFMETFLGAGLFASNYVFLNEAGYFAREAKYELLLHTWSLSVEWQFYFLIPLLMLLAGPSFRFWMILIITTSSFLFSMYLIDNGKGAQAFFSVFPRIWELGVGGILAMSGAKLSTGRTTVAVVRVLGFSCVALAIFLYDENTQFPGISALLPVIGTLLLLIPARMDPVSPILSSGPLVWLGQRSYSLYLWHWPLIVLVNLYVPSPNDGVFVAVLAASVLLAAFSYKFIENPLRHRQLLSGNFGFCGSLAALVAVMVLGFFTAHTTMMKDIQTAARSEKYGKLAVFAEKIEMRTLEYHSKVNLNFDGKSGSFNNQVFAGHTCSFDHSNTVERVLKCIRGLSENDTVLIIGDSHGRDFFHAVRSAYPSRNFVMLHQSACGPIEYSKKRPRLLCFPDLQFVLSELGKSGEIQKVIMAARWDGSEPELVSNTIRTLNESDMEHLIIGPKPVLKAKVGKLVRNMVWNGESISTDTYIAPKLYRENIKKLEARFQGYGETFVPVSHLICSTRKGCPLMVAQENPLFFDKEHLTLPAIELFATGLRETVRLTDFLSYTTR